MAQTSVSDAPVSAFEGMVQSNAQFPNTIGSHPASGSIYYGKAVSLYSDAEVTPGNQRVKLPASGNLGRASKACSAETYNLDPGQTVILDVDNVGGATATWDAAAATIVDTTSYPVADQDTLSFTLTITGGEYSGVVQTVLFAATTTTALQVAAAINDQCVGLSAVAGAQVTVTTDGQGTDYDIAFAAGTSGLTFAASTAGTGDVGDINAVTAAEFETVLEADTTATVTVTSGVPTIYSPTVGSGSELDFTGGTALTAFGLSVEVISAPAAGDLAPTNFKGVAIADTSLESTSNAYGEYVDRDSVPVMKKGRIWVVSADTVDDLSKGVYIRFQNGSSSPPADTLGSFRATTNADYQLMGDNVRWVAGQTIGGVYYGLLELNLDI
jgi:hypothetical protein